MAWIEPITNRASGVQYTYEDLNRVGNDIQFLADLLNFYGYAVTVSTKTDWTIYGEPNADDMTLYLDNVTALKATFYGTTTLPETLTDLSAEQANNIEELLIEIETYITRMIAGFRHCGTFKSGQGVILP